MDALKKCEIWNIGTCIYINSSLVDDVTSNGEGRGGNEGGGEKALLFCDQLKCLTRGSGKSST